MSAKVDTSFHTTLTDLEYQLQEAIRTLKQDYNQTRLVLTRFRSLFNAVRSEQDYAELLNEAALVDSHNVKVRDLQKQLDDKTKALGNASLNVRRSNASVRSLQKYINDREEEKQKLLEEKERAERELIVKDRLLIKLEKQMVKESDESRNEIAELRSMLGIQSADVSMCARPTRIIQETLTPSESLSFCTHSITVPHDMDIVPKTEPLPIENTFTLENMKGEFISEIEEPMVAEGAYLDIEPGEIQRGVGVESQENEKKKRGRPQKPWGELSERSKKRRRSKVSKSKKTTPSDGEKLNSLRRAGQPNPLVVKEEDPLTDVSSGVDESDDENESLRSVDESSSSQGDGDLLGEEDIPEGELIVRDVILVNSSMTSLPPMETLNEFGRIVVDVTFRRAMPESSVVNKLWTTFGFKLSYSAIPYQFEFRQMVGGRLFRPRLTPGAEWDIDKLLAVCGEGPILIAAPVLDGFDTRPYEIPYTSVKPALNVPTADDTNTSEPDS